MEDTGQTSFRVETLHRGPDKKWKPLRVLLIRKGHSKMLEPTWKDIDIFVWVVAEVRSVERGVLANKKGSKFRREGYIRACISASKWGFFTILGLVVPQGFSTKCRSCAWWDFFTLGCNSVGLRRKTFIVLFLSLDGYLIICLFVNNPHESSF